MGFNRTEPDKWIYGIVGIEFRRNYSLKHESVATNKIMYGMVCQSSVPRGFSVERYVPAFIEHCEFVGLGESRITEQSPCKQKGNYRNGKIIEKKLQAFS